MRRFYMRTGTLGDWPALCETPNTIVELFGAISEGESLATREIIEEQGKPGG